ncbi:MAG TPA: hypothetical protein VGA42_08490 [Gemmatimonadales bacterium]
MSRLGDFARSLRPGNDHQLAADLNANASRQRRASHRNGGATRAARQGQAWEDADRQREKNRGRRR